jgi:hypothetical protein
MIDAYYPTTEQLQARKRSRNMFLLILALLSAILVFGTMITLYLLFPRVELTSLIALGVAIFITVATPVMIWNNPRIGLYILFAACCLIENDGRVNKARVFTTYIPFFLNYNTIGLFFHAKVLNPIKFCPAEQFIVLAFMSWLIRAIAKRELHFERGAFLNTILLYIACVTVGFIHGLATGGDFLDAVWEVRPQFLFLAAYILAANVLTDRKQLMPIFWITIILLGFRGLLGVQGYLELIQSGPISDQGILAHEDSLMFNILFFIPIILSFCKAPRKLIWWSLLFVPAAAFADLENNRRAGIAAFIIAFAALLLIMWQLVPERRTAITRFIIATGLISTIYLPVAWNATGAWAFPARAIRSQSDPNGRDQQSDAYRYEEDTDLQYTRDTSPWIGYGYGKPWIEIMPLPKVTTTFLQLVAHDSVLWVWMRLGHIGFFCFMMMLATVLIRGPQLCRATKDPILLAFGIIAILYFLMCYIYGKYDLQYVNYRSMIMLGMLTGILGIVPKLAADEHLIEADKPKVAPTPETDDEFVVPDLKLGASILDSSLFDRK